MFSIIERAKEKKANFRATLSRNGIHTVLNWNIGNKSIAGRRLRS
jgi:hypothetical protein